MKYLLASALSVLVLAAPATAQLTPDSSPAPGYSSLMSADYASAVREIRSNPGAPDDAGRAMGQVRRGLRPLRRRGRPQLPRTLQNLVKPGCTSRRPR